MKGMHEQIEWVKAIMNLNSIYESFPENVSGSRYF